MKRPRLVELDDVEHEAGTDSETEELQEAFAKGLLKPGLNIPVLKKPQVNNVEALKQKLSELNNNLDWIERLDCYSKPAPIPPELEAQMRETEKRKDTFAYDELKHESMFYRQAQDAVLECIPKLHALGVKTKRPEDYFAEMAKTDEHMQKVKAMLIKKKAVVERVEKARQIRAQKKLAKAVQAQSKVAKVEAKREMLNEVKKFRRGERKDLSFLDDKPQQRKSNKNQTPRYKDTKYGFGGKKRGLKNNTRESTMELPPKGGPKKQFGKGGQKSFGKGGQRPFGKLGAKGAGGGKAKGAKPLRPGKNRRKMMKSKKSR